MAYKLAKLDITTLSLSGLRTARECLNHIVQHRKKALIVGGLIITMAIFYAAFTTMSSVHTPVTNTSDLAYELKAIKEQLITLKNDLKHINAEPEDHQLLVNIDSLKHDLATVATSSDIKQLQDKLNLIRSDINSQVNDLRKEINDKILHKETLNASVLPFQVLSVDMINGQPFVNVEFDHHIAPLSVGDVLSGWRLFSADYDSATAQFLNEHNQYVKVNLET